jgi:predicted O-methyltransferase YrrM
MWITTLNFGIRRIFLIVVVLITVGFLIKSTSQQLSLMFLTCAVLISLETIWATYHFGVTRRLKRFFIGKTVYEIRDSIFPAEPSRNVRSLLIPKLGWTESKLFLSRRKDWAYFDILRSLIDQPRSALILGGGGCTLALTLLQRYPNIVIDVVELDALMIRMAQEYFLKNSNISRLRIFHDDAFAFVQSHHHKYDLLFVDISMHGEVSARITSPRFLKVLPHLLNPGGLLVINLGKFNSPLVTKSIRRLRKTLHSMEIYLWRTSFLATNRRTARLKNTITIPQEK